MYNIYNDVFLVLFKLHKLNLCTLSICIKLIIIIICFVDKSKEDKKCKDSRSKNDGASASGIAKNTDSEVDQSKYSQTKAVAITTTENTSLSTSCASSQNSEKSLDHRDPTKVEEIYPSLPRPEDDAAAVSNDNMDGGLVKV